MAWKPRKQGARARARKAGFRSGFEMDATRAAMKHGDVEYERRAFGYTIPESRHEYWPDAILESGVVVEMKGLFDLNDRKKILLVIAQNQGLDLRFVVMDRNTIISDARTVNKKTIADWLNKNGIQWAEGRIPKHWHEVDHETPSRWAAIDRWGRIKPPPVARAPRPKLTRAQAQMKKMAKSIAKMKKDEDK